MWHIEMPHCKGKCPALLSNLSTTQENFPQKNTLAYLFNRSLIGGEEKVFNPDTWADVPAEGAAVFVAGIRPASRRSRRVGEGVEPGRHRFSVDCPFHGRRWVSVVGEATVRHGPVCPDGFFSQNFDFFWRNWKKKKIL